MKIRSLVAAAAVLMVLGGLLWWSGRHKATPAANPNTPAMVKVTPSSVERLTLEARGAEPIVVARTSPRRWEIQSTGPYLASSATVNQMLSTVGDLHALRVIEDKPANLSRYGLSDPGFQFALAGKSGAATTIRFGDDAPAGGGIYAMVSGDARVFLAPSWAKTSLDKSVDELRDKRLLPLDSDTIANFSLIQPKETLHFVRVQGGWQIEQPKKYRTDTFEVDDVLNQTLGARWMASTDAAKAQAGFAHGKPVATVKLEGSGGDEQMEIREEDGNYFAKSSMSPGVWQIDEAVGEAVSRGLDSFRNRQLFNFGYTDPDKVEVHNGTKALFLARAGQTWWSAGMQMDTGAVENLISALRSLAAANFASSGLTKPTIQLAVTFDGGRKVETVEIQKTGTGGIAKRSDGATLYAINSGMMDGLMSSIDGVKPAPAHKK